MKIPRPKSGLYTGCIRHVPFKLRSNGLSFHEFRPRFVLFLVVGTRRIDVARGLVSGSVVSRVVAVSSSHIKGTRRCHCICSLEHCRDICKGKRRRNGAAVQIPPTIVHKCEPRAT
ncbi:hypothetical protein AVEN_204782-1 [Araneus ventricosus]|uniref:Uncharacterized protein n=1 Tax=Araneus ventricosus TaxID=182803 RepID=A0A4Y2N945_ARAVE|nr:hypothetical protein AVEN_267606-1 [Araneus ventricosus]GBN35895.1 hypothetical protein AVEN_204782-1 [Araneus ventricosus]